MSGVVNIQTISNVLGEAVAMSRSTTYNGWMKVWGCEGKSSDRNILNGESSFECPFSCDNVQGQMAESISFAVCQLHQYTYVIDCCHGFEINVTNTTAVVCNFVEFNVYVSIFLTHHLNVAC